MDWSILILVLTIFLVLMGMATYSDTKSQLARMEHKLNVLLQHHGVDLLKGLSISERVKEIARDPARKIEAIKAYRDETGAGLAEAKKAVETFINSQ